MSTSSVSRWARTVALARVPAPRCRPKSKEISFWPMAPATVWPLVTTKHSEPREAMATPEPVRTRRPSGFSRMIWTAEGRMRWSTFSRRGGSTGVVPQPPHSARMVAHAARVRMRTRTVSNISALASVLIPSHRPYVVITPGVKPAGSRRAWHRPCSLLGTVLDQPRPQSRPFFRRPGKEEHAYGTHGQFAAGNRGDAHHRHRARMGAGSDACLTGGPRERAGRFARGNGEEGRCEHRDGSSLLGYFRSIPADARSHRGYSGPGRGPAGNADGHPGRVEGQSGVRAAAGQEYRDAPRGGGPTRAEDAASHAEDAVARGLTEKWARHTVPRPFFPMQTLYGQ